jgi:hypothetical protein
MKEGMQKIFVFIFFLSFAGELKAQQADYILLKKKNDKVLKTYFEGAFFSAETYDGFRMHGIIRAIRNDSIILLQEESRLIGTAFGTTLDTVRYVFGTNVNQVKRFFYDETYQLGGKKGFKSIRLTKLMMVVGTGFVILELVNTLYREESIQDNNKLPSLAIATGVAATGWLWSHIKNKRDRVGKKYVVQYVRAKEIIR